MASSNDGVSSEATNDLVTLLSKGRVDEEVLKVYAEKGLLDIPDKDGQTPLMVACLKRFEDVVKFLLENGANPNSKNLTEGNTPLHFACTGDCTCDFIPARPAYERLNTIRSRKNTWRTAWSRVPIVKLLMSYGAAAAAVKNNDGWSPPCVAAFYMQKDAVDYFLTLDDGDAIPVEEKLKAAELLGVSTALRYVDTEREDIYHAFSRALVFQQDALLPTAPPIVSELADRFSKVSWTECQTEEDLKSIKESEVGLKAHAFMIGERLYPKILKQRYLYPSLVIFASELFEKKMWDGVLQVLSCALCFEQQGDLKLGSVASSIAETFHEIFDDYYPASVIDLEPDEEYLQYVRTLILEFGSVLQHVNIDSLSANVDSIMKSFGRILLNEAYYCSIADILQSTMEAVEKSVRIIRSRIQKENPEKFHKLPSVAYEMMYHLPHECEIDLGSLRRVRFILSKILLGESVSYKNSDGNTFLHLVADYARHAGEAESELDGYYPDISEDIKDLVRVFIRHGCPIDAVNEKGKTAKEVFEDIQIEDDEEMPEEYTEFPSLLSPPTTVLILEEIAIRAILKHNIVYQETLPPFLREVVESGLKDFDLVRENLY